jgi:hypothetical protein
MELKLSAFSQEEFDLDSSNLRQNTQDWSSAKVTPESNELQIKFQNVYFASEMYHTFDPVSPKKDACVIGQASCTFCSQIKN